mgnify:FL=1
MSQPSVSKVVRHAEDLWGCALFDRRKGRLYPTAAEVVLFDYVSVIYGQLSALDRTAGNIRTRKGGHLRIGVLPSLGFAIAPSIVAAMRAHDPNVSFDLATLHSKDITAGLLEKRFDLCIGFDDEFDDRIRCQVINSVGLYVLAQKGEFAPDCEMLAVQSLDGKELIGLRDSGPVADRIETFLTQAGVAPHVAISAQTYYIAAELVARGMGIAIVDGFTARRFASDDVQSYPLGNSPALPFVALTLAEESHSSLVASSITVLRDLFG